MGLFGIHLYNKVEVVSLMDAFDGVSKRALTHILFLGHHLAGC